MNNLGKLEQYFRDRPPMAVAVSGGVDSMTLAVIAHRANPETQIFHAVSPAVPAQATIRVKEHAKKEGWQLSIVDAGEMHDPQYLANPANRCYFCKTNLYDTVTEHTELTVASGTNMDDLGDYRPGLIAAEEHQVCHPYVEVGLDKTALRAIAGELGLEDLKDLPAAPCLSSRVTTGIAINASLLPLINEVEQAVWPLIEPYIELKGVRCRIREQEIGLQIETVDEIDSQAVYLDEVKALVRTIFIDAGFPDQVQSVVIESYEKGSAFLIETLQLS